MKRALVLGGLGVVGQGLIEELTKSPEWEVIGLSRRPPPAACRTSWVSVDLLDRAACEEKLSQLPEITHIFWHRLLRKAQLRRRSRAESGGAQERGGNCAETARSHRQAPQFANRKQCKGCH
ncbi:MAG: NAD-dependent epimerase/dehydratase family protein [Acetobacteraceae bacterium]|nr:NAD-dependent epimerase/dehydratase family protein [Acetobacteraceae bacterium]